MKKSNKPTIGTVKWGVRHARLEHEILDSKIATAVALFNEWIKWCKAEGIEPQAMTIIPELFRSNRPAVELDGEWERS